MPPEQGNATVSGPRDAGEARPRVLVVADNATERLVLARQLDRLGLVATAVGDGTAAVEAVRRERYDAVLMDRHLPAEDGLEATRLIRRAPRGIDLPIIVMSADTRAEHKRECLDAGVNDYLPKPLEMARLRTSSAARRHSSARSGWRCCAASSSSPPAPARGRSPWWPRSRSSASRFPPPWSGHARCSRSFRTRSSVPSAASSTSRSRGRC